MSFPNSPYSVSYVHAMVPMLVPIEEELSTSVENLAT
jgi:hypothetical protein